ncbi:hypothetical protein CKA32_003160 [Geitlerinema sp. FC II]|nr:hypothetical protein CKA32_003160 [Geitlerinema sp. FC II]
MRISFNFNICADLRKLWSGCDSGEIDRLSGAENFSRSGD